MVHLDDDRKERVGEEEDLGTFREEDDDRGRLLAYSYSGQTQALYGLGRGMDG